MASDRLQRCVLFACEKHFGQWREGEDPLPYISHPMEVMATLRHVGGINDEAMLCAAILHDVMEETETTYEELLETAGKKAAGLVKELTREEPTEERTAGMSKDEIWELRAAMLLQEIGQMSKEAQTIKLCDRISNVREAKHAKKGKKLERYVRQTWRILDIVPRNVNERLWDALEAEARAYGDRP